MKALLNHSVSSQLIRKIIRTPNLWLETMPIGQVTHTPVGIMYIHGIANEKIVEEVRTTAKADRY